MYRADCQQVSAANKRDDAVVVKEPCESERAQDDAGQTPTVSAQFGARKLNLTRMYSEKFWGGRPALVGMGSMIGADRLLPKDAKSQLSMNTAFHV